MKLGNVAVGGCLIVGCLYILSLEFSSLFTRRTRQEPAITFCVRAQPDDWPDMDIVRVQSGQELHVADGLARHTDGWICSRPYAGAEDARRGFRGEYHIHLFGGTSVTRVEARFFGSDGRIERRELMRDPGRRRVWRLRVEIPPSDPSTLPVVTPFLGEPSSLRGE